MKRLMTFLKVQRWILLLDKQKAIENIMLFYYILIFQLKSWFYDLESSNSNSKSDLS